MRISVDCLQDAQNNLICNDRKENVKLELGTDLIEHTSLMNESEEIKEPEKVNMSRIILKNEISEKYASEVEENDTFYLAKDSLLFSQISKNEIILFDNNVKTDNNECRIVEIKECQVPIHPSEHLVTLQGVEYNPEVVEVVEIIETDGDFDSTIEIEEGIEKNFELLNKKFYYDLPKNQKTEYDCPHVPNTDKCPLVDAHSILVEVTDRINHVEEMTVKACNTINFYNLSSTKPQSNDTPKELKLKKEIKMSRTFQILGNFHSSISSSGECKNIYSNDKDTKDILSFSNDEENNNPKDDFSVSSDEYICDVSAELNLTEVGSLSKPIIVGT